MKGVKEFRKITKDVTAVQITRDLFSEKVPEEFKDRIVINPAARQVILYGKGNKSVTGKLSDWLVMDDAGNLSIITHADFIDNYEPAGEYPVGEDNESGIGIPENIGIDLGSEDTTVTGQLNTGPGEDINLDNMGSDIPDDLKTEGKNPVNTGSGEGKENIESKE